MEYGKPIKTITTQNGPRLVAPACCPPLGDSGEEYYCKRDDFIRYIEDEVNPAREKCKLRPLDLKTAEECYRILNDFARQWGCDPIGDNVGGAAASEKR